jgi:hypothetical protein
MEAATTVKMPVPKLVMLSEITFMVEHTIAIYVIVFGFEYYRYDSPLEKPEESHSKIVSVSHETTLRQHALSLLLFHFFFIVQINPANELLPKEKQKVLCELVPAGLRYYIILPVAY